MITITIIIKNNNTNFDAYSRMCHNNDIVEFPIKIAALVIHEYLFDVTG